MPGNFIDVAGIDVLASNLGVGSGGVPVWMTMGWGGWVAASSPMMRLVEVEAYGLLLRRAVVHVEQVPYFSVQFFPVKRLSPSVITAEHEGA